MADLENEVHDNLDHTLLENSVHLEEGWLFHLFVFNVIYQNLCLKCSLFA